MAKKQDVGVELDETIEENEADARVYELGFHLDPELPTEEVKKAYKVVRDLIESKGTIVAEGEPHMMQLSYMISRQETVGRRDFSSAYFCWIAYETTAVPHSEILTAVNANKQMVRFIDLVTSKDAARHSVEIREFAEKSQKHSGEIEVSADTELDTALANVAV